MPAQCGSGQWAASSGLRPCWIMRDHPAGAPQRTHQCPGNRVCCVRHPSLTVGFTGPLWSSSWPVIIRSCPWVQGAACSGSSRWFPCLSHQFTLCSSWTASGLGIPQAAGAGSAPLATVSTARHRHFELAFASKGGSGSFFIYLLGEGGGKTSGGALKTCPLMLLTPPPQLCLSILALWFFSCIL